MTDEASVASNDVPLVPETAPRKKGIPVVGLLIAIVVSLILSPITYQFAVWFQVFDLPEDRHKLAMDVLDIGFRCGQGWLLLLLGSPIALIVCLIFRRLRRFAVIPLAIFVVAAGSYIALPKFLHLRDEGFSRITFNAQPLLAAIEQYKADQGVWPPSLDALVPAYIDKIPYTGAPGYPKFNYEVASEGTPFREYQLSVKTPRGSTYHDQLIYWPEMNYPLWIKGATVEPLNDWAYMERH
ncbi:MAG: hypothetical protein K1Y02_09200 [Candidatus Hydrogenedentes bacterium]|nr:hypothetical protein [Candidatus Hydrogenedentota bacterium]